MYASAGCGKAGDCVELVFLRPFCMEGAMSLSLPACRMSCPTQPTLAGGARDTTMRACRAMGGGGGGTGVDALQQQPLALLLACVPGGVGLLPVVVCSSLMGKT
jgi:hypothetical protein